MDMTTMDPVGFVGSTGEALSTLFAEAVTTLSSLDVTMTEAPQLFTDNDSFSQNSTTTANGTIPVRMPVRTIPEIITQTSFYTSAVLLPIVCTLGIIGNILNLVVLSRKEMRSSTTCFLMALAVSDFMLCLTTFPSAFFQIYNRVNSGNTSRTISLGQQYYSLALYYLANVCITYTSWMTMCVTTERFLAIRFPHKVRLMCTIKRSLIAIFSLFAFSVFGHMSKIFEYQPNPNVTSLNSRKLPTALGRNKMYVSIMHWTNISVAVVIPFMYLFIVNTLLVYSLVKLSQVKGLQMTKSKANQHKNNMHITTAVVAMVTVFIFCHSLGVYTAFNIAVHGRAKAFSNPNNYAVALVNNLLVTVNSAVNFILYCLISSRFRGIFLKTLCRKEDPKKAKGTPIVKNKPNIQMSLSSGGTTSTSAGSRSSLGGKRRSSPNVSRNNMKISQMMNSSDESEHKNLTLKLSNGSTDIIIANKQSPHRARKNTNEASGNNNMKKVNNKGAKDGNNDDNWIACPGNQDNENEMIELQEPLLDHTADANVQRSASSADPNLKLATVNKRNLNRNLSDRKVLPCGAQRINPPPDEKDSTEETDIITHM